MSIEEIEKKIESIRSSVAKTVAYLAILTVSLLIINFIFGWARIEEIPPQLKPFSNIIIMIQPYVVYIQAALIFAFGYMAVRAVSNVTYTYARRVVDHPTAAAIRTITKIAGLALLLSMLASVFNVNPSAALTAGSFAGLVVGFATQTILSHVVAGIFLLLSRPFKYGDVITIAGRTGRVKEITLMHIVLETTDGKNEILIPSRNAVTQIIQKQKIETMGKVED